MAAQTYEKYSQNRQLNETIRDRLQESAPLIQVILGPRQIGKTTALKNALAERGVYESADSPTPLPASILEEWWAQAVRSPDKILAVDEVQKIPGWTEVLKKLWDANPRSLKVLVTGSSSLLVEKGLRETLAGRFELIRAEHWNLEEAERILGLNQSNFIEYGAYPGAAPFLLDPSRWGSYIRDSIIEPALGRDLLQLHPVDQPALLRQIFGLAVSLPAEIVSLQKLQGQLQGKGSLPTLQHYLRLLGDAYLVTGVPKYSGNILRSRGSSPKLIVHDNALLRAFRRPLSAPLTSAEFGRYFENAVGARFVEAGWETFYWKDRDDEVDFVVFGPQGEKWAVEVKSAETTGAALKGLRAFGCRYPGFEPCLVSWIDQAIPQVRTLPRRDILSLRR
jgi:predicted AAA+ superfamily ATPase